MQWLEITALILALGYVILAARGNQWCWPLAFVSTALYTAIFWQVALVSESLLNGYYMVMAIVGWLSWRKSSTEHDNSPIEISRRSMTWHMITIAFLSIVATGWGWLMHSGVQASYAYIDAFTTVFALFATWMLTQRIR